MKTRPRPGRTRLAKAAALAKQDNRVARAVDALATHLADKKAVPEPLLADFGDFTDQELVAIWVLAYARAKADEFDMNHLMRKLDMTRPVLAYPRKTDRALDLFRTLREPELLELWGRWNGRTGSRGRDPGYLAKALLVVTAELGKSPYLECNYEILTGEPARVDENDRITRPEDRVPTRYELVFDWIEHEAAARVGRRPQAFGLKAYEKACEQIGLIVNQVRNPGALTTDICVGTNVEALRWLSVTYPDVCRRLALDAVFVKGWVPQVGRRSAEREAQIRKRAPNASPRTHRRRDGKSEFLGRGYWLYVLTDIATGLPVVWGLYPGGDSNYGARALRYLLNDLHERWPDCPTTHIVADREWDTREAIADCALRFGIHLIVDRDDEPDDDEVRPGNKGPKRYTLDRFDYPDIGWYDRVGNSFCPHHDGDVFLKRTGVNFVHPERRRELGLRPGEAAPENLFRIRLACPHPDCAGSVKNRQLHMAVDWAALSAYPHTRLGGRSDFHAERLALYARRNGCAEGLFSSLKAAHKLVGSGVDRTRTANEATLETLLNLALLLRTGFVVAHERIEQGAPARPPDDLLTALAAAR